MTNKLKMFAIITAINLSSFGCNINSPNNSETSGNINNIVMTETATTQHETILTSLTTEPATTTSIVETSTKATTTTIATTTEPVITTIEIKAEYPPFSLNNIPAYSGSPYVEVNGNVPYFEEFPTEVFESYSPLDSLGRCGVAYANVCTDIMSTEPRGEIGMIKPSGWQTIKYNGIIEGNYLYNRCHLIGYQLAGENANELNLITGTRYMNTVGMEPFENKVANYVESYCAHVLYRVTPIYEGDNLVASGVLMEAYSLEDRGAGLEFCVYCYNVQPGIGIDYSNGDSWLNQISTTEGLQEEPDRESSQGNDTQTYILNTNTKKFHYPSCPSVEQMKDKNKKDYSGSRDEIIEMGYEPCKRCNP